MSAGGVVDVEAEWLVVSVVVVVPGAPADELDMLCASAGAATSKAASAIVVRARVPVRIMCSFVGVDTV